MRDNLRLQAPPHVDRTAIPTATAAFPRLGERLDQVAGTLSGGEQQMLAISHAYLANPSFVFLDEVSLGLAPRIVDSIFEFLHRVTREQGVSLLIVDQFVTRALEMASAAYVLRQGEIVYDGPPADLLAGNVFEQYVGS